jgi:hydroxylamine dehydrogenase
MKMALKNTAIKFEKIYMIFLLIITLCLNGASVWAELSSETKKCISCHQFTSAAIYTQWSSGKHADQDIGCYECHQTEQNGPDIFMHEGFSISIIVSPMDCARCHEAQVKDYDESLHAGAESILEKNPRAFELGNVVMGEPVVRMSCTDCHGSTVKVLENGRLDPNTWPNTGVGRVNPDGSRGGCSACHQRHKFSKAQARRPRTCGRCHIGHDKPQIAVYEASKHGIAFDANEGLMNLDSANWVVGVDYFFAPTCVTCHLSAAPGVAATHNPAYRLSWVLRKEISERRDNWQTNRNQMMKVCTECHASDFITSWYGNFDNLTEFYDNKFGKPSVNIMSKLREAGKITPQEFDDKIEWTFFQMWKNEGRTIRNAAAMQSSEAVQSGFIHLAKYFYTEFLPEAKILSADIVDEVLAAPEHKWYTAGSLINGVSSAELTADLNQDGKVDSMDLLYFKEYWHR